jgi:hypothetical protein
MEVFWAIVPITAIGCGTAVVLTFIDKVFGGKHKQYEEKLRAAEERARQLELHLADERRHNDQLQKQVDWHGKLLETQDRMLNRLSAPPSSPDLPGERTLPERAAVR